MQIAAQLDRFFPRSVLCSRLYLVMVLLLLPLIALLLFAGRFIQAVRSR